MRLLKNLLRKIYHFIAFLSLFLLFSPIVKADNNLYVNYSGLVTSYANYNNSIQCNATNCVVYGVRYYFNQDFTTKWTTSTSQTCQNGASLTGKFSTTGSGEWTLNTDWLSDHLKQVFIDTNNNRYSCSFSFSTSSTGNADINYSCYVPKLTANFSVGYIFARSSSSSTYANATEVVANRNFTFDCDNTASSIIDNNNVNTDRITNNNNYNSDRIINNNNQNSQNIINNNNQNTQDVINNQNSNTDKQIESQMACKTYDISSATTSGFLSTDGLVYDSPASKVTPFINLSKDDKLIKLNNASQYANRLCFYNDSKTVISCLGNTDYSNITDISIPNNTSYVRFTININENKPTFKICKNGNQALNDSITDDSAPDIDLDLNVASDTPISDLVTMPLTILNALVQNLNSSCQNYSMPFFYNTTLTFPCFTISDYLGSTVTNYIDLFICFYMCYNIGMLVVSIFEDITSLNDIYDSLYTPKHADTGYVPKHAKGGAN